MISSSSPAMSLTLRATACTRFIISASRPFCTAAGGSGNDSKKDLKKLLKKHKLNEKKSSPTPVSTASSGDNVSEDSKKKLNDLLLKFNERRASTKQNEAVRMARPNAVTEEDLEPVSMEGVDPDVAVAAHRVSRHLAKDDRGKTKRIESDLVKRLKSIAEDTDSSQESMAGGEKGADIAQMLGSFKVCVKLG